MASQAPLFCTFWSICSSCEPSTGGEKHTRQTRCPLRWCTMNWANGPPMGCGEDACTWVTCKTLAQAVDAPLAGDAEVLAAGDRVELDHVAVQVV